VAVIEFHFEQTSQKITSHDVSVIVQGPVVSGSDHEITTAKSLQSIREYLPAAEIILSTWNVAETTGLDFDQLVISTDPGAQRRPDGLPFNLNRQITSTLAGLAKATRPFAVKMRTDCALTGDAFLSLPRQQPPRFEKTRIFSERVLIIEIYTRNSVDQPPHLFHPSDIFQFGRSADLRTLWDCELHANSQVGPTCSTWRFSPEQFIWLSCLRRVGGLNFCLPHFQAFSMRLAVESEISIVNNFAIYSCATANVTLPPKLQRSNPEAVLSQTDWQHLCFIYSRQWRARLRWMRFAFHQLGYGSEHEKLFKFAVLMLGIFALLPIAYVEGFSIDAISLTGCVLLLYFIGKKFGHDAVFRQ